MGKGLSQHFRKETSLFLLATLTGTSTTDRNQQLTSANCSASTMRIKNERQNVSEQHNHPLAPSGNEHLILASFRFSNTAVQRLLVQQPVQQRRRTSAIKQNTQRTEHGCFQHKMDRGEHQRTTYVESPLRHYLFTTIHRCLPPAPQANRISTVIHRNLLLSTGFAVSFAVKGDRKMPCGSVFRGSAHEEKRATTNKNCGSFYFRA